MMPFGKLGDFQWFIRSSDERSYTLNLITPLLKCDELYIELMNIGWMKM